MTVVAFIYSAANVRSGKKVGGEGRKQDRDSSLPLPGNSPPTPLQCALRQSRNQAGHGLLSFHPTIGLDFLPHGLQAPSSPGYPSLS